jgi:hypothetical protein
MSIVEQIKKEIDETRRNRQQHGASIEMDVETFNDFLIATRGKKEVGRYFGIPIYLSSQIKGFEIHINIGELK